MVLISLLFIIIITKIIEKSKEFKKEDYGTILKVFDFLDKLISLIVLVFLFIGIEPEKLDNYKDIILVLICLKILSIVFSHLDFSKDYNSSI